MYGRFSRGFAAAIALAALTAWGLGSSDMSAWGAGKPKNSKGRPAKKPEPPAPKLPVRRVVIKPVDQTAAAAVLKSAKQVDELVDTRHRQLKVEPMPKTTDEQFVRRIYLDITGTIPTYKQVNVFVTGKGADKRARLIDALLNSEGYASHLYNYWSNILRLTDRLDRNLPGAPFSQWVKKSIEENTPYDKWVYEMLTAEGKYFEHPETGYLIKDGGMPLDAMSNTLRVFIGTQIGCAQCHNHPFDQWTQKEFYEMAAFTFGTQTRLGGKDKMFGGKNVISDIREELKKVDPKYTNGGKYNVILTANLYAVHDVPYRKLKLPHDYQYDDAKPETLVAPATLLGPDAPVKSGETPRLAFSRWLTSKENPRFALTIANRLWKHAFGRGQIEPVDDIREDSAGENPELLKFLTAEMIRLKFDTKEFLRILYNTDAYQRQASVDEVGPGDPYHFPGPMLRRMTAEQAWDSFITLAVFKPEEYKQRPAEIEVQVVDFDLRTVKAAEVMERLEKQKEINGYKARSEREKNYRYKGQLLVRASELPTPTPPGHFLREFGQSDRELIESSSADGSVPQVLAMFNGPITHMLLEEGSLMYHNVMAKDRPEDRINVIFLSTLSRKPTAPEMQIALEEVREAGPAGYGNIIWSLVNTREFLFIQ
jgi:hypothetical protein